MATLTERILVKIDVVAGNATKGLKDFRSSVSEAEGVTGKLKAGTKSLGDTFKGAAKNPALLAGGVTAAAGIALKAVDDFADLGVEIGKFSDATGLAAEDASRWAEVSGDLGISLDSLQGAIGKLNKNIDPKVFADFGIEIAKTNDGATDVNQTFLNVITRLHEIKDPAEQARVAAKLLGKGWQGASELIGMSADDIKKRLGEVSDQKVFTPDEIAKARKYRDVMDDAGDVVEDLAITIGENLLPAVIAVVGVVKPAAEGIGWLADQTSKLKKATSDNQGNSFFGNLKENVGWFIDNIREGRSPWEAFSGQADKAADSQADLNKVMSDGSRIWSTNSDNVETVNDLLLEDAEAAKKATDQTRKLRQSIEDLNDIQLEGINTKLDSFRANLALTEQQQKLNDVLKDAKASTEDQATAALDMAETVADAAAATLKLNGHTQTATERNGSMVMTLASIRDTLAPDSPLRKYLDEYIASLLKIPTNVSTRISITGAGAGNAGRAAPGFGQGPDGTRSVANGVVINNNINVRTLPTQRELIDTAKNTARRTGVNLGG